MCCISAVTGKRTESTGILITTSLWMWTFLFFHVAQDKHLQCMWKLNITEKKFGDMAGVKMCQGLFSLPSFSPLLSWKLSSVLSWLFNLVACLVQLILDIHCFLLASFLSWELSVPYRYPERAASSGRKEYFRQLTAGSHEPGLHAYVPYRREYVWIQWVMRRNIHKTRQVRSANPCDLKSLLL